MNIDINLVKEFFGQEGIDILLEQQRKIYNASQTHDDDIERNGSTLIYNSIKWYS